jgi:hypothetical protein
MTMIRISAEGSQHPRPLAHRRVRHVQNCRRTFPEPEQIPRISNSDGRHSGNDQQQRARDRVQSRVGHGSQRDLRNLRQNPAVCRRNKTESLHHRSDGRPLRLPGDSGWNGR